MLEEGETLVERELAGDEGSPGVLLLTDRRVLFYRTSTVGGSGTSCRVTAARGDHDRRRLGATFADPEAGSAPLGSAGETETVLEHIPGGEARARRRSPARSSGSATR